MQQSTLHTFSPVPHLFAGMSALEESDLGSTYLCYDSLHAGYRAPDQLDQCGFSPGSAPSWQAPNLPSSTFLLQAVGIPPSPRSGRGIDTAAGLPCFKASCCSLRTTLSGRLVNFSVERGQQQHLRHPSWD